MAEVYAGKFIVLDGPDGCGKSTHSGLVVQWLLDKGVATVNFRDPGTTTIGEKIRDILLSVEYDAMDTRTELLLYMAARAQLWKEEIRPALNEDKCVILDRWLSSTCSYQGYAGGFGADKVIQIAEDCLERAWPDLTIILDVDAETAAQRLNRELDRMEAKGGDYHRKVREGFLELAGQRDGFVVIDARGEVEAVHEKVMEGISSHFST